VGGGALLCDKATHDLLFPINVLSVILLSSKEFGTAHIPNELSIKIKINKNHFTL